jgi:hypothetical protein
MLHNRCLNVARRPIDVPVEAELQVNAGEADCTRRCHLSDVSDLAEVALQWRRHRGGHDLRRRASQLSSHRNGRKINLRQWRYRELKKSERTGRGDHEGQQYRGNGPPNEGS